MFNVRKYFLNWFLSLCLKLLKVGHIPRHVAFIMDGNRRYADKTGLLKPLGHERGYNKLLDVLYWCMDFNITEVTVYSFSIENFRRNKSEVKIIMHLFKQKLEELLEEKDVLINQEVCIRVIGNLSLIPKDVRKLVAQLMVSTMDNNKIFLNIAFAYSSRDEITHAIKNVVKGVNNNDILLEDINEDLISKCLYTYNSPNPGLLIRTSGETRISDFLMWQISDTCIYFVDVLWPEFSVWNFLRAIAYYQRCYPDLKRNIEAQALELTVDNDRVSTYIDKLHHENYVMLKKMYLPANKLQKE